MSRFCPLFSRPQNNHKLHAFSLSQERSKMATYCWSIPECCVTEVKVSLTGSSLFRKGVRETNVRYGVTPETIFFFFITLICRHWIYAMQATVVLLRQGQLIVNCVYTRFSTSQQPYTICLTIDSLSIHMKLEMPSVKRWKRNWNRPREDIGHNTSYKSDLFHLLIVHFSPESWA